MGVINSLALSEEDRGLAVSFHREARRFAGHGTGYYDAHRVHGAMGSAPETRAMRAARAVVARPHTIGFHSALPDGPDITASAVTIKEPNSLVLGVPGALDFTLPIARLAGSDVLSLYGAERFRNSEILLIVQRTDMDPGEAHRPNFSDWHDHMWSPSGEIDLIYCFSSIIQPPDAKELTLSGLPTEFDIGGQIVPALPNALTRFGAEIEHRSPQNPNPETLRRVWGACIVTNGRRSATRFDNRPYNVATDDSRILEFRRNANRYLREAAVLVTSNEFGSPLAAVA